MSENFFDRQRAAVVRLTDAVRARAAAEAELTADVRCRRREGRARGRTGPQVERSCSRGRARPHRRDPRLVRRRDRAKVRFRAIHRRSGPRGSPHNDHREVQGRRTARPHRARRPLVAHRFHARGGRKGREGAARIASAQGRRRARSESPRSGAEAEPALARGRVTRAEVECRRTARADDDDPITRMNKAVQAAEEAIRRLARL